VFPWLRRFTYSSSQIDPYVLRRHLRPALLREYQPSDFDTCIDLYRANEPGRFPPGILPEFEESLRAGHSTYLILEHEGRAVGCGGIGIAHYQRSSWAHLCFGLIDPAHHRQGLGSVLLLGRLSLLPPGEWTIGLSTVPKSRRFFEKACFQQFRQTIEGGMKRSDHAGHLHESDRQLCKQFLKEAKVEMRMRDVVVANQEVSIDVAAGRQPVPV
jgi:N-acetylglutamate synthase-like GNAT family acetyltransferase